MRLAGVADGWAWLELRPQHAAVIPTADLISHDPDPEDGTACVCGPTTVPVLCTDGGTGWVYIHQALDGREEQRGITDQDQR
jgi:hypothetical protein